MIVYPKNWKDIGNKIKLEKISDILSQIISKIPCDCLAFSGGLDSSLLLYFMAKVHRRITAFTIGLSEDHPDIVNSRLLAGKYSKVRHRVFIPTQSEIRKEKRAGDLEGDNAVRLFYKFVNRYTDGIISGDGLDEFMCGYYRHQSEPSEGTYYNFIRRLQKEHLIPLNENSGQVRVYLPYLDNRLISAFSQIPIAEKVDKKKRKRIINLIAKGKVPDCIISRWKYGFCDSFKIKT